MSQDIPVPAAMSISMLPPSGLPIHQCIGTQQTDIWTVCQQKQVVSCDMMEYYRVWDDESVAMVRKNYYSNKSCSNNRSYPKWPVVPPECENI